MLLSEFQAAGAQSIESDGIHENNAEHTLSCDEHWKRWLEMMRTIGVSQVVRRYDGSVVFLVSGGGIFSNSAKSYFHSQKPSEWGHEVISLDAVSLRCDGAYTRLDGRWSLYLEPNCS